MKSLERIKQYLDVKGVTIQTMERKLEFSNGSFSNQLKRGKSIGVDKLEKILQTYTDLNPTWVLTGRGPMLIGDIDIMSEPASHYENLSQFPGDARRIDETDEPVRLTNKSGIDFLSYPNGEIKIEVYEVPFPAYATFTESFDDEQKLKHEFAKATFPVDKLGRGYYLGFRVTGDSMNGGGIDDTPDGAQVLGRELQKHHWLDGFHKNLYGFVLFTKYAIYHKDIANFDMKTGLLTLSSRNKKHKDFDISINDVFRIFKVIKRSF